MKRLAAKCLSGSWQELLIAVNKQLEEVLVSRAALENVCDCHVRHGYRVPPELVSQQGRKRVEVSRSTLWDLVQAHGKVCGKEKVNHGYSDVP